MTDPATIDRLRRSVLSAIALRELQPDWSDPVIDEWLNIIDNFATVSEIIDVGIDQKIEEIPTDFTDGSIPVVSGNLLVEANASLFFDLVTKILKTVIFQSTVATGTSPLIIASTTLVSNLNADLLDGQHAAYFLPAASYKVEDGTAVGQLLFWDGTEYKHTETTELYWNDTEKTLLIGGDIKGPNRAKQYFFAGF